MPTIHDTPPAPVQTDLNSLAQAHNTGIPAKNNTNLLIATWNLRRFGSLTREWTAYAADTPKRDLRGLQKESLHFHLFPLLPAFISSQ
jgi:hypothetical protein